MFTNRLYNCDFRRGIYSSEVLFKFFKLSLIFKLTPFNYLITPIILLYRGSNSYFQHYFIKVRTLTLNIINISILPLSTMPISSPVFFFLVK